MTLILAVFGAAALSLQYELYLQTNWGVVHVAVMIILFGLVAWCSMGFMDRYYNKLLAGAVSKSTAIEDKYDEDWLGMTHEITKASRRFLCFENFKARNQMLCFLYGPVLLIGLLYLWAVAVWFQPSYVGTASQRTPGLGRPTEVPKVGSVPKVMPRLAAPTEAPATQRPSGEK
jgi:hypothetical protein